MGQVLYKCPAYKDLVVINRGYDLFNLQTDLQKEIIVCPVCGTQKRLKIKNCGFVNAEWSMRGILK